MHQTNSLVPPPSLLFSFANLVLASSLLASLELVKVPTADSQRALVLVHAPSEVANIGLASPWALVVLSLRVGVVVSHLRLLLLGWCGRAAAAEESTDGVADGGADCDTAGRWSVCAFDEYKMDKNSRCSAGHLAEEAGATAALLGGLWWWVLLGLRWVRGGAHLPLWLRWHGAAWALLRRWW